MLIRLIAAIVLLLALGALALLARLPKPQQHYTPTNLPDSLDARPHLD